jgi:short-subunit dehydrogenase involved in D-alanine esterification of teichoic acids
MYVTGNTVFIPGATSGIGLALARRFAERGNTVIIGGRRVDVLERLAAEEGFDTVEIDITDPHSITAAAAHVIGKHPELNIVLAMAGIQKPEDWHSADGFLTTAEQTVATNLLGPIRLIAAFTEHLQSRPDAAIITVSSGLASVPLALTATYCATKAAIHSLTESLRLQLADTSVQVIELVPPAVQTSLMNNVNNPRAMPLDAFVDASFAILETEPDVHEVLVENVKFQRFAERRGEYEKVLGVINSGHQG